MSLNALSVGTIWAQSLSLNNLVRPQKEGLGDLEADGLGGPHVDDQLELRGLLHGQVRGLGPFQDFVHVGGGAPEVIQEDRRVGHEATGVHILPQSVYIAGSRCLAARPTMRVRWAKVNGSSSVMRARARSRLAASNARSKSSGPRTPRDCSVTPNARAPACATFKSSALNGLAAVPKTAPRGSLGTISLSSSNRLALNSGKRRDTPVMFPPGRARLVTNP